MTPPHARGWLHSNAAGGMLLIAVTILAVVWANSPGGELYQRLCAWQLTLLGGRAAITHALKDWINDGLMTCFFLQVGLEIKRELINGHLRRPRQAALPVLAACGGMLAPAAIFLMCTWGTAQARGWAIPMATDIAFALGVLALLGSRIPSGLRVFLATLAIIDDLGAVAVITVVFTRHVSIWLLALALLLVAVGAVLNRLQVASMRWYLLLGVGLWWAIQGSGVHATISGIALAVVIPCRTGFAADGSADAATAADREPTGERLQRALRPLVTWGIMPLFVLANAGVPLHGLLASGVAPAHLGLALGIVLGLLIGKPLGILLTSGLALKLGLAELPAAVTPRQLAGAACLAGIGFTMALFIAALACSDALSLRLGVAAVLLSSLLSALLGGAILWRR